MRLDAECMSGETARDALLDLLDPVHEGSLACRRRPVERPGRASLVDDPYGTSCLCPTLRSVAKAFDQRHTDDRAMYPGS